MLFSCDRYINAVLFCKETIWMTGLDDQMNEMLIEEGLRFYSDTSAGFFRQKVGRSTNQFDYYDLDGKKIRDTAVLERIGELAIPPAWKNVWVSPKKNSHLQATGIDDRGRKQYLYHPDWIRATQEAKFSKLSEFGLQLPQIRSKVSHDMNRKVLDKQKLIATIVWLLEHTFIRIGNDQYAKENNSYGLTTLRNKHVSVRGSDIVFKFRGKSGVNHLLEISNPIVAKTIKKCIELPGYELFQFIDEDGDRHIIDSADVNQFLKHVTQNDFSAKDFRTWGATTLSAQNLYQAGQWEDEKSLKSTVHSTVKAVSQHLGNTVSVCRNYYIHPTVIESYEKQLLIPHFEKNKGKSKYKGLRWEESAVVELLKS